MAGAKNGRRQPDPAGLFYWRDYFASGRVQRMSWPERGVYVHLLGRMFLSGDGWIGSDDDSLSIALGVRPGEVAGLVTDAVRECFVQRDDGKIANERMLEELSERESFRESQSEAGKRGAAKRWGKGGDPTPADGDPMATPFETDGESKGRHVSPMANDSSHPIPFHPNPTLKNPPASPGPPTDASASEPPPKAAGTSKRKRKPPRRRWRVVQADDGTLDVVGVDDQDLADDDAMGPDVDVPAFRRLRFAPRIVELGDKAPKDLRRAFYRPAIPERREPGGWLAREQAAAAEGRSPFARGASVDDVAARTDPKASNRITIEAFGDWPINRFGFDPDRDGEWFDIRRQERDGGERFYVSSTGWIAAEGAGATGAGLRKATLDEVFGLFAEPNRDADVANRWRIELAMAGERGRALAQKYATQMRAARSKEIGRLINGNGASGSSTAASSVGDVLNGKG